MNAYSILRTLFQKSHDGYVGRHSCEKEKVIAAKLLEKPYLHFINEVEFYIIENHQAEALEGLG